MKLLIVEDNPEMRRLMKRTLAGLATEITECEDGSEALSAYSRMLPDWALIDIEMNRMDGITAAAQITSAFPEARIIIVTNHDEESLRQAARGAGACGYVLKENLLDLRMLLQDGPQ